MRNFFTQLRAGEGVTQKRYQIQLYLQWRTNRKSYMVYGTTPFSMTLNNT